MTTRFDTSWRIVRLASVLLIVAALGGATYQGISTARERRALPYPGRLVDVGGYQLHILCAGEGTPTVLLESPSGGISAGWAPVQARLAAHTRVCAYDRAGLGWSEAGEPGFDPQRQPEVTALLLRQAREKPPFVVVGHGIGAVFAARLADARPDLVSAVVTLSGAGARTPLERGVVRLGSWAAWLARFGVLRASSQLTRYAPGDPDAFPVAAARAFLNRPDHLTRAAQELAGQAAAEAQAPAAGAARVLTMTMTLDGTSFITGDETERVADTVLRAVRAVRAASAATLLVP